MPASYPTESAERDAWILARRPVHHRPDGRQAHAFLQENERSETGAIVPVATIFLTNRECPWRCLMCDLWKNTLTERIAPGLIPVQIDEALTALRISHPLLPARRVKLYNSGSFFDTGAISPEDYPAIAEQLAGFERVIVECHPALITERVLQFRERLAPTLEIAMGLETIHPGVLPRLNKRMTIEQFARAAGFLRTHGIALRAFVLVQPPFMLESEAVEWAVRSAEFAFECGAGVVSLIPTRAGNGALDALQAIGEFTPPRLSTFELALDRSLELRRGRVFGDLWDFEKFSPCPSCRTARRERIARMNLSQAIEPRVSCSDCAPDGRPAAKRAPNQLTVG